MACPFGVIDISSDGKIMIKCDLCFERIKAGEEPACVEACPTKALKYVDERDLVASKRQKAAKELALSAKQDKQKKKKKENT
jgi:carbon-monoxide dehydrogenase iron sulfur subunit